MTYSPPIPLYAALTACAAAMLTPGPSFSHEAVNSGALESLPMLSEVAPDAIQISPHIPRMGQHWANPENLPGGPIYCEIEGRVTCVEYMVNMADLEAGTDWTGLVPGIETPPISHIDIEFKANGIEPNPVPLYQFHIFFASPATLAEN